MMTYYRTDDQVIHEEEKLSDGVWVQMINQHMMSVRKLLRN